MLFVLSPAKSLDYSRKFDNIKSTIPTFLSETKKLVKELKSLSEKEIAKLMDISEKLAKLNHERYINFPNKYESSSETLQAICCFDGDSYTDIEVEKYKESDFEFAQKSMRILSGLYGVLKPLDMLYPYRLEMGTDTKKLLGKSLYEFWGNKISEELNLAESRYLINLASEEYFKAVNTKKLNCKVINVVFKNNKDGKLKVIGINSKRARGAMANFIIKNKITKPEDLKQFGERGYEFSAENSNEKEMVFIS